LSSSSPSPIGNWKNLIQNGTFRKDVSTINVILKVKEQFIFHALEETLMFFNFHVKEVSVNVFFNCRR